MRVGDPDGHGRFGVLDSDDEGRLLCHVCGRWWQHLATHALGVGTRLVGAGPRARMRAAYDRHRDVHLAALEGSRDPLAALAASPSHRGVRQWRPETRAARQAAGAARRGRDLTGEEVAWLLGDEDLQGWADRARVLLAGGVSHRSLSEASGIAAATVGQRLRRYPPR